MLLPLLNGSRRAVASVLAAVTLAVLVIATLVLIGGSGRVGPAAALLLGVFLGLHAVALTWLLGQSPWPDPDHLIELLAHDRDPDKEDPDDLPF